MLTYRISDWTEDPIHIVDHELYDLVHAIKNRDIPTRSYKGVDVYHLADSESRMLCIRDTQHEHEDFIELIYVRSGSGIASIDGQQYMIQKGDIMFVYPHQAHANLPMPTLCVTNCLLATALVRRRSALFEPCIGQNGTLTFPTIQHLGADTMLKTEQLLDRIAKEANGHLPYYHEAVLYAMNELLLLLKRHEQQSPGRGVQRSLAATLDFIQAHLDTVTMAEAAAIGSYNPTYFSRLFRNEVGANFTEYVNKLRIHKAIMLLLSTDLPIEEISLNVGFKSKIHFYDVFRKYTGATPGAIRRSKTEPPAAPQLPPL